MRSSNTTFPLSESYFVASFFEGLFSSDKMYKWFLSKDDDERTVYYDLESCVPTKKMIQKKIHGVIYSTFLEKIIK